MSVVLLYQKGTRDKERGITEFVQASTSNPKPFAGLFQEVDPVSINEVPHGVVASGGSVGSGITGPKA